MSVEVTNNRTKNTAIPIIDRKSGIKGGVYIYDLPGADANITYKMPLPNHELVQNKEEEGKENLKIKMAEVKQ